MYLKIHMRAGNGNGFGIEGFFKSLMEEYLAPEGDGPKPDCGEEVV